MSLRYWFPLIKDVKNYGLSQVDNFNNASGLSSFGGGKLGQSYYANSLHYLCNAPIDFTLGEELSIALWVRPMAFENTYNYLFQLMNDSETSYANTVCGLCVEPNASTPRFKLVIGGFNSNSKSFTLADRLILNEWCHIAIVWKDNKEYLYLNGLPQVYLDGISPNSALHATSLSIGCNKNGENGINAYLNDLRIYDHALSTKEIKEISKGLIAHYKLDRVETKNYLIPPYDRSEKYNTTGVVSSTSTNHYTNIITTERIDPLPGSGIYTYSAYIYNTSNANICVSCILCNSDGENLGTWAYGNYILPGEEGLSTVTIDGTALVDVASARGRLYYSKSLKDMTSEFSYQYFKFEKNPVYTYWTPGGNEPHVTIYDCSGYSNNGTGYDNLTVAAGSPRYNTAVEFSNQGYYKGLPSLSNSTNLVNKYTIAFWLNKTEENTSTQNEYVLSAGPIQIRASSNGYLNLLRTDFKTTNDGETITSGSNVPSLGKLLVGEWHYYAIVFDDGEILYYKDGEYKYTKTGLGQHLYGEYNTVKVIGQHLLAKLSDLRIYMTALTAAAVKELYNTSMQVDASGNVYARELVQL